ncbi:MAG TPA: ethanolamine ammonia-lyase reactivating factor EutA [Bryobacteraceae bacterium]|nr:ethanolamine ammonia-lyase reactivating factor EutA [Bryobacteraceae bacterium]
MLSEQVGGRVFFSSSGRSLSEEDQISLLTVGVDIGSSTSHLMFSRIVMERLDSRYVVASRETLYESDILLTPFANADTIDAAALGDFIASQYRAAGVDPGIIDTGALILTGLAVKRQNARAVGDLFSRDAGKMVAVSAGDSLEAIMAAHGSGAVARSLRESSTVLNLDIGGGTSKIAVCAEGKVVAQIAVEVGARLVRTEGLPPSSRCALAGGMADRLMETIQGWLPAGLHIDCITVSGGVSEYFYEAETRDFGDLGSELAAAVRNRLRQWGVRIESPEQRIRATVIGASQYTTQVSGGTIYVSPLTTLPLRNIPVIAPEMDLDRERIESDDVAKAVRESMRRLDLTDSTTPIAVFVPWRGSATFARLDAFCRGIAEALGNLPIVLASDGDTGGLIGIHFHEELQIPNAVVSIDNLELREFDYIDIGTLLDLSGAVPVVIKSLLFPASI